MQDILLELSSRSKVRLLRDKKERKGIVQSEGSVGLETRVEKGVGQGERGTTGQTNHQASSNHEKDQPFKIEHINQETNKKESIGTKKRNGSKKRTHKKVLNIPAIKLEHSNNGQNNKQPSDNERGKQSIAQLENINTQVNQTPIQSQATHKSPSKQQLLEGYTTNNPSNGNNQQIDNQTTNSKPEKSPKKRCKFLSTNHFSYQQQIAEIFTDCQIKMIQKIGSLTSETGVFKSLFYSVRQSNSRPCFIYRLNKFTKWLRTQNRLVLSPIFARNIHTINGAVWSRSKALDFTNENTLMELLWILEKLEIQQFEAMFPQIKELSPAYMKQLELKQVKEIWLKLMTSQ